MENHRLLRPKPKRIQLTKKSIHLLSIGIGIMIISLCLWPSNLSMVPEEKYISTVHTELLKQETYDVPLFQSSGTAIGKGWINGENYYLFQTVENDTLSSLYKLPMNQVEVLINQDENHIQTKVYTYQDTIYNSNTNKYEYQEREAYEYTIYLASNQMKEYGVIEERQQNSIIFFPFFFRTY